jgi:hypothetical protein
MGVVYSMYDALVSINVPTEKAKAVIDAMEREMMDKVATKADVENLRLASKADLDHVRDVLSRDIRSLELATKADIKHLREMVSKDIQNLSTTMTVRLGTISGVWMGILFALLKLTA